MAKAKLKEIVNKKAKFEYHFLTEFEAGIQLVGTEVKALRIGDTNMNDAYCVIHRGEMLIRSLFIGEYSHGNINNHETRRDRKLLLRKTELNKIERKIKEKGLTLVPYKIYFGARGFVKIQLFLAQGKKAYDKRNSIKDRDQKRDMDRISKFDD